MERRWLNIPVVASALMSRPRYPTMYEESMNTVLIQASTMSSGFVVWLMALTFHHAGYTKKKEKHLLSRHSQSAHISVAQGRSVVSHAQLSRVHGLSTGLAF